MTAYSLSNLAFRKLLKSTPKFITVSDCQSNRTSETGSIFGSQRVKLRDRLNLENKFELSEAFDHILKGDSHRIGAEFVCWHCDKHPLRLSNYMPTKSQKSVTICHICTCGKACKKTRTAADMHFGTHHQGVNRRSRANQCSLISIHQQHRGMPILSAHYVYRDCQRSYRADRLNPSRPIRLRQFVLIAQQCDVNDAENYQECDREVGIFHALAESCLKGILA